MLGVHSVSVFAGCKIRIRKFGFLLFDYVCKLWQLELKLFDLFFVAIDVPLDFLYGVDILHCHYLFYRAARMDDLISLTDGFVGLECDGHLFDV